MLIIKMRPMGVFPRGEKARSLSQALMGDAVEALRAQPAPDLHAMIVKLALAHEILDGHTVEEELAPFLKRSGAISGAKPA